MKLGEMLFREVPVLHAFQIRPDCAWYLRTGQPIYEEGEFFDQSLMCLVTGTLSWYLADQPVYNVMPLSEWATNVGER